MNRQSPAERCIRAIILEGHANAVVHRWLGRHRIDRVDDDYMDELRREMVLPDPFRPEDVTDVPSQRVLAEYSAVPWFRLDDEMKAARRLLRWGRAREVAEAMLISGAPTSWISKELRRNEQVVSPRAIEMFAGYFFNVSTLDNSDLVRFLADRRGVSVAELDPEDVRVVAARSRGTGLGLVGTLMRLGRMPSNLELSTVLASARTAASVSTLDAIVRGRPRRAERFASVARSVNEMLGAVGDPQEGLLERLSSVNMITDTAALPLIDELGEHSDGMEPVTRENVTETH
jgi:hypothetical protein